MNSPRFALAGMLVVCPLALLAQSAAAQESVPLPPPAQIGAPPEVAAPSAVAPEVSPRPPAATATPASVLADRGPEPAGWFSRPSLTLSAGEGAQRFSITFFGFVEADYIFDTTRSYDDAIGSDLVARSDTYAGRVGRSQVSMRNTRLGFALASPTVGSLKPTAVIEGDFFGHQDSPPAATEGTFFDSPTFRIRHAFLKLQSPYLDVVAGQTYDVFGWQNAFFPCSLEFLGLPNQLFSRNPQLRLSRTFNPEGSVSLDVAVSASRPAQRDSEIPDASGGLRLAFGGWKGITTPGNVGTTVMPLSLGVSAILRQFKANAFTPPPAQSSNNIMGWGISLDALIPIIPAANAGDRGNRLTLVGSYVRGTGIADLITSGGGAKFQPLLNPEQANPPPVYQADIDNGLVTFDKNGVLHTIDWTAFRIGLQYYLPPSGRLVVSVNYTQSDSANMANLYPQGGAEIELLGSVAKTSRYADANLFWDATPAVRLGISGQVTQVKYLDGNTPHNIRGMLQSLYVF